MPLMKVAGLCALFLICFGTSQGFSWARIPGIVASPTSGFQEDKQDDTKPKTYTNQDLSGTDEPKNGGTAAGPKPARQVKNTRDSRSTADLDNYRDVHGNDRSYWQKKIRPLRHKLDNLDVQIHDLQEQQGNTNVTSGIKVSKKGRLHADQRDSPAALAKKMDDLKQKRLAVQKSIQEVEEDGRKAQALPEWLR
jgi:hypothetical protein